MPFSLKERRSGPVLILELAGRLTMGEGTDKLDATLQKLIAAGERQLLLDCAGVSSIDSQGIKSIVWGVTSVGKRGGKLKLLKVSSRVREVLDITRLLTVIEAFDDEAAAMRSF
ncbi:MAG: STAS domain-containing protein [Acidobacteria bacterium]|nr:STAS domain-containing protein [Acidobacteriota bacterium]